MNRSIRTRLRLAAAAAILLSRCTLPGAEGASAGGAAAAPPQPGQQTVTPPQVVHGGYPAVSPDGKNRHEITSVPGRTPVLSPDGKRLLYMAGTWMETKLIVANADGSNAQMINDGKSIAWNNHWSPDASRIAFTGRNAPNGPSAVFVMKADGTERRQVTHISPDEGSAQWPVWSPDGSRFAIQVSNLKSHSACIWTVDIKTGAARKLAAHDSPYLDETPYWFPDGKRIAFQSDRTGQMEVWVMNADGSAPEQVTGK